MTLLDDLERLHAEASTVGFQSPDAAATRARWIADVRNAAPRLLAMLRAAESACFHYWSCMGECDKTRGAMAVLAKACEFTSDPATDAEIATAVSAYDAAKGE